MVVEYMGGGNTCLFWPRDETHQSTEVRQVSAIFDELRQVSSPQVSSVSSVSSTVSSVCFVGFVTQVSLIDTDEPRTIDEPIDEPGRNPFRHRGERVTEPA